MRREVIKSYRQDLSEVRRLCLLSHGLELTGDKLFSNSTYSQASEDTKTIYQNVLSSSILGLAVAIRTNLYQGKFMEGNAGDLSHCGAFYYDDDLVQRDFSIKDVCDKLIHADTIEKYAYSEEVEEVRNSKICMQIKGCHRGRNWTLDLSVELFTEAVLNYLDSLDLD